MVELTVKQYITRRAFSRAHTCPLTLTFDLELPKFNHLVLCGQGYNWPSLVTMWLQLEPATPLDRESDVCTSDALYTLHHYVTRFYWLAQRRPFKNQLITDSHSSLKPQLSCLENCSRQHYTVDRRVNGQSSKICQVSAEITV